MFPNRNLLFCVFCSGKPIHWCTKQEGKDHFLRKSLHRKYIGKWILSGRYIPVFKLKTGTQQTRFGDSRVSAEVHSRERQNFSEEGFGKVLGKACKRIQVQRLQDKH